MPLDYYLLKITHLAIVVILAGALTGCYRLRTWPSAVQLLGAACMVAAVAIGYLMPLRPDPGTNSVTLGATWRTQEVLSSGGVLLFALGYAAQHLRGRKGSA